MWKMSRRDGMLRDVEMGYDIMVLECSLSVLHGNGVLFTYLFIESSCGYTFGLVESDDG